MVSREIIKKKGQGGGEQEATAREGLGFLFNRFQENAIFTISKYFDFYFFFKTESTNVKTSIYLLKLCNFLCHFNTISIAKH